MDPNQSNEAMFLVMLAMNRNISHLESQLALAQERIHSDAFLIRHQQANIHDLHTANQRGAIMNHRRQTATTILLNGNEQLYQMLKDIMGEFRETRKYAEASTAVMMESDTALHYLEDVDFVDLTTDEETEEEEI